MEAAARNAIATTARNWENEMGAGVGAATGRRFVGGAACGDRMTLRKKFMTPYAHQEQGAQ